MRFYIAGMFSRRSEFIRYSELLEYKGHQCTARWLHTETDMKLLDDLERSRMALMDATDVAVCELLLNFTEEPSKEVPGIGRGGRHVELGIAVGINMVKQRSSFPSKRIVVIGPQENIFHYLDYVDKVYPHFSDFLEYGLA